MEVTGTQAWIQAARSAVKALRAQMRPDPKVPVPSEFPPSPIENRNLRYLEETQSEEALEGKGLIVNRYL